MNGAKLFQVWEEIAILLIERINKIVVHKMIVHSHKNKVKGMKTKAIERMTTKIKNRKATIWKMMKVSFNGLEANLNNLVAASQVKVKLETSIKTNKDKLARRTSKQERFKKATIGTMNKERGPTKLKPQEKIDSNSLTKKSEKICKINRKNNTDRRFQMKRTQVNLLPSQDPLHNIVTT